MLVLIQPHVACCCVSVTCGTRLGFALLSQLWLGCTKMTPSPPSASPLNSLLPTFPPLLPVSETAQSLAHKTTTALPCEGTLHQMRSPLDHTRGVDLNCHHLLHSGINPITSCTQVLTSSQAISHSIFLTAYVNFEPLWAVQKSRMRSRKRSRRRPGNEATEV